MPSPTTRWSCRPRRSGVGLESLALRGRRLDIVRREACDLRTARAVGLPSPHKNPSTCVHTRPVTIPLRSSPACRRTTRRRRLPAAVISHRHRSGARHTQRKIVGASFVASARTSHGTVCHALPSLECPERAERPFSTLPYSFLNRRSEVRVLPGAPGKWLRGNRLRVWMHVRLRRLLLRCSFRSSGCRRDERSDSRTESGLVGRAKSVDEQLI